MRGNTGLFVILCGYMVLQILLVEVATSVSGPQVAKTSGKGGRARGA